MKILFVDFEASSLGSDSHPIEIAWVDSNAHGESYLIQRHWSWTGWSDESERIHGLSQETLRRDGRPPQWVAQRAYEALQDAILISDNPAFDEVWLMILLKVISLPPLRVYDIRSVLDTEIARVRAVTDQDNCDCAIQIMAAFEGANLGYRHEHRALPDALELWRKWRAVRTVANQQIDGKKAGSE